jgi:hypothetical protein
LQSGATPLWWWPQSDFIREESELSTKLNTLALLLVPLLPETHYYGFHQSRLVLA